MSDESTPEPAQTELRLVPAPPPSEVPPERLRWRCGTECFEFESTDELSDLDEIIGQSRAVDAILLGLSVRTRGYNIFVAGLSGTGKMTTVRRIMRELDRSGGKPTDKCFVHNFKDADRPALLTFEAGRGRLFKSQMAQLVEALKQDIPKLFESPAFEQRQQALIAQVTAAESSIISAFDQAVGAAGFALVQGEPGTRPQIAYKHGEDAVRLEALRELDPDISDERMAELAATYQELNAKLGETLKRARKVAREAQRRNEELRRTFASDVVELDLSDLREQFRDGKVQSYLDQVTSFVLDSLPLFEAVPEGEVPPEAFRIFGVNVVVQHSEDAGAPIVIEDAPNVRTLFGSIERPADPQGQQPSDFLHIKSGSLLDADGGYLVFNIADAINDPDVWPTLKRTLKNGTLTIQAQEYLMGGGPLSLKPEPIPIDAKVIVVGDHETYHVLYELDEDFRKIFKVKAEYDSMMPRTPDSVNQIAHFVHSRCRDESLKSFDRSGVAAVVEEAVRLTARNDKITTRFSDVADVVVEANHWAAVGGAARVSEDHVDRAIFERDRRLNLVEERVREMFMDGSLLMQTEGAEVGSINGLTYLDAGDHGFGHPIRLTAVTAMGRAGIINIEREVELSGKAHSKGVLILEGFLRGRYAQDKPLSMSSSIAFEQSYSNIDGDSASSTEIYALLSSLSGVPIRQGVAVTGSVNQHGIVQPIGSINEKIEGFFALCKLRGFTGDQGVLVPELNAPDLMLSKEIVRAVENGQFRVYSIRTIDEGLEVLTGLAAGERDAEGLFPEGTMNRLVDDRLIELAEGLREFGEPPETGDEDEREVE